MGGSVPSGLYYLFGGLMLAVAAYSVTLIVLGFMTDRPAGRDVELSHVFMGVAMAGMFVGRWSFGPNALWEVVFAALMVWFAVASIQSVQRYGLHLPHALVHAVMNLAMLLMYWFPGGAGPAGGSMTMSVGSSGARVDPGLALVLAVILCASAVFTLASPIKGRSHFGSHAPAYVTDGECDLRGRGGGPGAGPASLLALEEAVALPWLVDVSHAVMCVAMAFMLLLLI